VKIKVKKIIDTLILLLLFTASIPYVVYAYNAIVSGYKVYGGLNMSKITPNVIGSMIAYCKDAIAALLLLFLLPKARKGFIKGIIVTFLIGVVSLFLSDHSDIKFIVAGTRTFMFFVVMTIYCQRYYLLMNRALLKKLLLVTEMTLALHTVFVFLQIISSNSLSRFGTGAYRFSGLFPGSGNLGCYCVGALLFVLTCKIKYQVGSNKILWVNIAQLLFLSIASGTRTCTIIVIFASVIALLSVYGKKLRIGREIIVLVVVVMLVVVGPNILNVLVSRTGRGALMESGSGRIAFFVNMVRTASVYELVFGRGIGVGTNASITMGLSGTQISDSTLNLLFTQFGFVGLIISSIWFVRLFVKLYYQTKAFRYLSVCWIITIIVMFLVGNLFEHIAMCLYLILVCAMLFYPELPTNE